MISASYINSMRRRFTLYRPSETTAGGKEKHVEYTAFNRNSCARPRGTSVLGFSPPVHLPRPCSRAQRGSYLSLIGNSRGTRPNLPCHRQQHRHRQITDCVVAPPATGPGCMVAAFSGGFDPPHRRPTFRSGLHQYVCWDYCGGFARTSPIQLKHFFGLTLQHR
jgi:hypothetical protein